MKIIWPLLLVLALAGCDKPNPSPIKNTWDNVAWDEARAQFLIGGHPVEVVEQWDLGKDSSAFQAVNAQGHARSGEGLEVSGGSGDPGIRSVSALAIPGGRGNMVLVHLTRVRAGGGWDGSLFYVTSRHGESEAYMNRPAGAEPPPVGEPATLVYDMSAPVSGRRDWRRSKIKQIRIDFDGDGAGQVIVHRIAIVKAPE